ncbi:hypothetical protein Mal4_26100 [Maioricimonas rarisocia]|uniref:Uncharacterized protein n=1 Tax=Maioricimonas rarisocia TaxID=2528026 RepID=A0A517Z741_9PLAN|nr:hypothetical protein [Maioricimonas rarisocia]QDU38283.1 hypothetical protein Mal4_26100 [Maioricimonas rarisocia]
MLTPQIQITPETHSPLLSRPVLAMLTGCAASITYLLGATVGLENTVPLAMAVLLAGLFAVACAMLVLIVTTRLTAELVDDSESARARWQAETMLVSRQAAQAQRLSLHVDRYLQQLYAEMIDWDDLRQTTSPETPSRRPPRVPRVAAALEQAEAGRLQADLRIFRPRRAA